MTWTVCTCRCAQLSARQLLFLTEQLAKTAKQELGQSMLHILVTAINDMLQDLPPEPPHPANRPPPKSRQALPHTTPADQAAALDSNELAAATKAGRNKAQTRHLPSKQQQRQESFRLLRLQEGLAGDAQHAKMQSARRKLPAFSKRTEVMTQLSQQSVVVISGATGTVCCQLLSITILTSNLLPGCTQRCCFDHCPLSLDSTLIASLVMTQSGCSVVCQLLNPQTVTRLSFTCQPAAISRHILSTTMTTSPSLPCLYLCRQLVLLAISRQDSLSFAISITTSSVLPQS